MNNKELIKSWEKRLALYAEGSKLYAEGDKLWAEGSKLSAEGRAEGSKLWVKAIKLRAEGSKLWVKTIRKVYGNILMEWKNWNEEYRSYECHLENGEIYGFDKEEENKKLS